MDNLSEKDWKYLSCIRPQLLEELSKRINNDVRSVLEDSSLTENDKRREIYKLISERDKDVADCFDDWRRSWAPVACSKFMRYGLLKPEHLENLTPETRNYLERR